MADIGRDFENEVRFFIEEKLGLKDVKGGDGFHIAASGKTNQTDVCGRFNDILFVFQCTASGRTTNKSLREKIFATRERSRIIEENYKSIPEYKNCKFVVFIFITKKIMINQFDLSLIKESSFPRMWYADENVIEYYSDLYEKIGDYAIYNFLSDFGVRPGHEEKIYATALKTSINNKTAYLFYVRPKQLIKFSYVARRRSKNEDYYQRMLEKSRMKKIREFLNDGGMFPTNIIISLKKNNPSIYEFSSITSDVPKDVEVGILKIYGSYDACWIIDGQHRLYSFYNSTSNVLVPCIAFENLNPPEERSFFLEINREQKPIQPDLIWDLEGSANPETEKGIISNAVKKLSHNDPFKDKIYIPIYGSKIGKSINMAAFCNGIKNASITKRVPPNFIGTENPIFSDKYSMMTNRLFKSLCNYFLSLSGKLDETQKKFLFGNAGIPILLYLFEPILARIGRIPDLNSLEPYTKLISEYFLDYDIERFKKIKEEANSEGARRNFARQIGYYIRKQRKDKLFWIRMEETQLENSIKIMERRIGKLLKKELSSLSTNWEKQRIPQNIYTSARAKMKKDGSDFDENFDLSEEFEVIKRKDNWTEIFEKIFTNSIEGFDSINDLENGFKYLAKVRNPDAHEKNIKIIKENLDLAKVYYDKFHKIVPEILFEEESD